MSESMHVSPARPGAAEPVPPAMAVLWQRYYMPLAVGAAVLVLLAIGLGMVLLQQRRGAERASQMLLVAQTPKQWEEVLAQYPRSPAAPVARLALANSFYQAGAYDEAQAAYTAFLEKHGRHPMAPAAELGKAQCLEGRGDVEGALNAYALFAVAHADHFLAPQALFGKARCLQLLQRLEEARAAYEDYIAAHPKDEWTSQAEFALRAVDRQLRARRASAGPADAP